MEVIRRLRRGRRSTVAALCASALAAGAACLGAASSPAGASLPAWTLVWQRSVPGGQFVLSSPVPATLDYTRGVVIGNTNGFVYAMNLANGNNLPGWPQATPGQVGVDSTASVGSNTVYVDVGTEAANSTGGYLALGGAGVTRWFRQVPMFPAGMTPTDPMAPVQASPTYGLMDGHYAVVAGTLGQYEGAVEVANGATETGFPWFAADSESSTPAIANVYGNGKDYIVEGGDSTAGLAYGVQYANGGHIRILSAMGNTGTGQPGGGLACAWQSSQIIQSSPAVGRFLSGNAVGVVSGTGIPFYAGAPDTDAVVALNTSCQVVWEQGNLAGTTMSSPALVTVSKAGGLQIAEGTANANGTGTVYLFQGQNGGIDGVYPVPGAVIGSITSADLGAGYQYLFVPTTAGLVIIDARNHVDLTPTPIGYGAIALQSAPLITDDPNGTIGVTIAGYNAFGGIVQHYEFRGTNGSKANEAGAWPMFHHDPQLSGSTLPRL